jgi:fructokinase
MATLLAQLSRTGSLASDALTRMDIKAVGDLLNWASCAAALNCERDGCDPPTLDELKNCYVKHGY